MSKQLKPYQLPRFEYEVEGDALLQCALSYIKKRAKNDTAPTGWWLAVDSGVLKITVKGEE
jgi:hypothetical protein